MVKRIVPNQDGFTLVEVLIALTVFAAFATAMVFRLSNNVSGSIQLSADLKLHNLAELKMNETLIGKKEFTNATANDVKTGSFEVEGYEDYKYKVEITNIKFPDFAQLMGNSEDDADANDSSNNRIQKAIFDKMKKNIEDMIWQVTVTVIAPDTEEYQLHSWINKSNAKIDTNFSF